MDFRVGIVITSLLLGTVQPDPSSRVCTSFKDLSEPCGCTLSHENFDPTCGSDGRTYLNVCFLECRKTIDKVDISIYHKGVCTIKETRCSCHAGYAPVCGSNGVTYSNKCVFDCLTNNDGRIRLKHIGECGSVHEQRLPNMVQMELGTCRCGSRLRSYYTQFGDNGQRYARSPCGCRKKKAKLLSAQTVQPASEPASEPAQNRASSNIQIQHANSRPNQKMLTAANSKMCACAAIHKPVCGSNRRTYANFCVLYCSSKKEPSVKLRHWGDCSSTR